MVYELDFSFWCLTGIEESILLLVKVQVFAGGQAICAENDEADRIN
jgi:hypothetical protein